MKLKKDGVTVEVVNPADVAFYKRYGYKEVKAVVSKEPLQIDSPEHFNQMTVAEIEAAVAGITDAGFLGTLIEFERAGKARKTALEALEARLVELSPPADLEKPAE